jgi:hypothetical protein
MFWAFILFAIAVLIAILVLALLNPIRAPAKDATGEPSKAVREMIPPGAAWNSGKHASSPEALERHLQRDNIEYDVQTLVAYGKFFGDAVAAFFVERNRLRLPDLAAPHTTPKFSDDLAPPKNNSSARITALTVGALLMEEQGYVAGGWADLPELSGLAQIRSSPFDLSIHRPVHGSPPKFYSFRLRSGRLGERGAEYEIRFRNDVGSAHSSNRAISDTAGVRDCWAILRDELGIVSWGYGDDGFHPQWLTTEQQRDLDGAYFQGDLEMFLRERPGSLVGQGSFYLGMPCLRVVSSNFSGQEGGSGELVNVDHIVQSYDEDATALVTGGALGWVEFTIMGEKGDWAAKIGFVQIGDRPRFSFASVISAAASPILPNGALGPALHARPMDVHIEPNPEGGRVWRGGGGKSYDLDWVVHIKGRGGGRLEFYAERENQEVVVGERAVYEGGFRYRGRLDVLGDREVQGFAFGEIQGSGSFYQISKMRTEVD